MSFFALFVIFLVIVFMKQKNGCQKRPALQTNNRRAHGLAKAESAVDGYQARDRLGGLTPDASR
jgi:hypothetical protein